MVRTETLGSEARSRLVNKGPGPVALAPYIEAIRGLTGDQTLEPEPEGGDSLRVVKLRLTTASNQLGRSVHSGETEEGTLLVWLQEGQPRRRRRRRRIEGSATPGLEYPGEVPSE